MNFKIVTLTNLKKDANRLFADVTRERPLRVLHRAHEIKVVILPGHGTGHGQNAADGRSGNEAPHIEQIRRYPCADTGHNRILIWKLSDIVADQDAAAATIVLGQTDFTGNGSGSTTSTLNAPHGLAVGFSGLYVTDTGNDRVLIFAR
jgi:hypothetical protein